MGVFKSEQFIPIIVPQLGPVADHLVTHFRAQSFTVVAANDAGVWDISITKGGMFKAVAGLKTALKIELKAFDNGTSVKAGIGVFGRRAAPALVVGLIYWPALIGQVWGLVRQAGLDNEAIGVVEAELRRLTRLGHATEIEGVEGPPPTADRPRDKKPSRKIAAAAAVAPAQTTGFCTGCGNRLENGVRFCSQCGQPAPTG
jgi:hypothetical protein